MKQVAIWAPLRYANYGDDMQAIAFAKVISKMGYGVKLYQLDSSLSDLYGFESVSSIRELLSNVSLCIIAGGALLTPFVWYKRIFNKAAREYEFDFRDLYNATLKYKQVKFCALSFGGDGKIRKPSSWYSAWRVKFLMSDNFIGSTVRLKGDVNQMKSLGKEVEYHADMLFYSPTIFIPLSLPVTKKYRVGFNFKKGKYIDKQLLKDIYQYALTHDDVEFHFTTTHMEKIGLDYQYIPKVVSRNIFIDRYETPEQLLGVLSSMDCFVTSMLHVGLTGLSTGTPFLSYRGPEKTKSFLRSIGGDWAILPQNVSFIELKKKYWSISRNELYNKYDTLKIEEMKKDSLFHYEFCKKIVENYG